MVSIYQVDPNELIKKVSKELEGFNEIKAPEWAKFAKTGHSRERPPEDPNWWYTRFAAVLRSIYKLGPIGVSKLRTKYGGKKNRGVRPEHFYRGSGNILRKILQQGEGAGLLKQTEKGVHKGRILTPKGKSLLDRVALSILKGKPVSTAKSRIEKSKKVPKEEPSVEKPAVEEKKVLEKPKEFQKPTKWYVLNPENQQQFEIRGPAKVRAFSRLGYVGKNITDYYYIFVREDGIDLGSYYFRTEKSTESSVVDSKHPVGKWRSLWLNIPAGKHYYTFSLPSMEANQDKTIFIRLKEWKEE